jgi:hypothetical protein
MDIVEDQHQRPGASNAFEESSNGPEALLCGSRPFPQADQFGDALGDSDRALDA